MIEHRRNIDFTKLWNNLKDADEFSGVFAVSDENGMIFEKCGGFRNINEKLPNNIDSAFGIASGTKLFTGLAVCKLIDEKKLTLSDLVCDLLPYDLGKVDRRVTVHHLLTHSSGIGDYIDEESSYCDEQLTMLYSQYPVYLWERLEYYLPMITVLPPKFMPGERFGYSNAGFVLLGLVIESVSGISYQQYVSDSIISPLALKRTGFYRTDSLPFNTALGYICDADSPMPRTNIFSIPIIGGSDGGLYTCAGDLDILWRSVYACKILSADMLEQFLDKQISRGGSKSYGLGVYRCDHGDNTIYYAVGGDFGVSFMTAYFAKQKIVVSALSNTDISAYPSLDSVISYIDD